MIEDSYDCIHDSTVDRTASGTGKVSELTLAQIRALDAGSWFDPQLAGENVPTVDSAGQVAVHRQNDLATESKRSNQGCIE